MCKDCKFSIEIVDRGECKLYCTSEKRIEMLKVKGIIEVKPNFGCKFFEKEKK